MLRGAIDHARYLGKEVFITFYGIEKCFDSLWLQDGTNALWDNGIIAYPTTSHGIWRFIPHRGDYIPRSEAEWDI